MHPPHTPPSLSSLLATETVREGSVAFIVAGHNGSGKSTLWYDRLADQLKVPLINADRLTLSLLPPAGPDQKLKSWASQLRDKDERWQMLSQKGVGLFLDLAMEQGLPFAFETVFSYFQHQPDGTIKSKIEVIRKLQERNYRVILLFVGLANVDLSILRVSTRRSQGGHDVPESKLRNRFPRTQQAIRMASEVADVTLMFDNSRGIDSAFTLVRAQRKETLLYDCRDRNFKTDPELIAIAGMWLANTAPL